MRWLFCIAVFFCFITSFAQNTEVDSLKKQLPKTGENLERVNVLEGLSYAYLSAYPDTALQYAMRGLELAKKIKSVKGEAICTNALGNVYFHVGDNAKALEMYLRYLQLKQSLKDWSSISIAYFNLASAYTEAKDFDHALYYLFKAKTEDEKAKDSSAILYDLYSLGSIYLRKESTDSALYFLNQSYKFGLSMDDKNMLGAILNTFGEAYLSLDSLPLAASYYRRSISFAAAINDNEVLTANYYGLAKIHKEDKHTDSSIFYARKALLIAQEAPFLKQVLEISSFLTGLFEVKKNYDSAFRYQQLSIATKDSLFNIEEDRKIQNLKFNELQRQQAIETAGIQYQNQVKLYVAAFIIIVFLLIVIVLWYNNKQKNKANTLLRAQKQELTTTLEKLRATQEQLVHSEKMASLGELTAGIAHEIQNPLNFVNNFSELNKEMIEELKEERNKKINERNIDAEHAILDDIITNLEKIAYHGKRADDIVKSMLQHSRKSTGQKEPTDINRLVDECLRLSYHGLRAKNKSFNADYKTEFDKSIRKINIVPQDVGRVILNLLNNAFYAVSKKQQQQEGNINYKPLVTISTKLQTALQGGWGALITITDNGIGIPQNIIDKIFQPFFTTKPTGQGTGLGLSLSYNIIVKEHGGTINVNSVEGEGSTFTIFLPVNDVV